jgi:tRNA U34 5-methylaminomethyl-2-thiouridine-forming methyltransferase MnmC
MMEIEGFSPELTGDGSFTFFSAEFGEAFHSQYGAKQEAEFKFVEPLQLRRKAHQKSLKILDICYGLGYNTAAGLAAIWGVNPHCRVEVVGLESDVRVPRTAIAHKLLNDYPFPIPKYLSILADEFRVNFDALNARLAIGDARETLRRVYESGFRADAICLDPFSPPVCPQLWTVEFLGLVAKCLKPDGRLATYSCAAAVRKALLTAGLAIASTEPKGRRTPGTVAGFDGTDLGPLTQKEREHLETRAAVPYRDPNGCDRAESIVERRRREQSTCSLEPSGNWKKRWKRRVDN